eukprot:1175530-Prorocentrum_minimum.AAC.3
MPRAYSIPIADVGHVQSGWVSHEKINQEEETGDVVLTLYETDIVRVKNTGEIILNTGGYTGVRSTLFGAYFASL